jgi:hypothetical protein
MSKSSAAPQDLQDYAHRARELDDRLVDVGHRLNVALQAFRGSRPDYGAPALDGLEGRVLALASACGDLDVWVGEVGEAFRKADGRAVPVYGPFLPGQGPGPIKQVNDKALAKRLKKEMERDGWDLGKAMKFAPRREWLDKTRPPNCDSRGVYSGGGYILGPDGEKYWITIPNYTVRDGKVERVYNGDLGNLRPGWGRIDDLNGDDAGWVPVARRQGVTSLGKENGLTRTMAGIASTAGYAPIEGEAAGKDEYMALAIDPGSGQPILVKGQRPALERPDGDHDKLGTLIQMSDGRTMFVDAHGADLNREQYRNKIVQEERAGVDKETAIPGAVGLGITVGDAMVAAWELDKRDLIAYQVVFEQNGDRRRAIVRSYHITAKDDRYLIWPAHLYVDGKGEIKAEGINWRQGDEIKPPDQARVANTGAQA